MVDHRWRGWVAPGGKVDPGETPREAVRRELFEGTGLTGELLGVPAAVTVRSYLPDWSAVMGVSFMAVVDHRPPLAAEDGQPAAWLRLDEPWRGYLSEDRLRMSVFHLEVAGHGAGVGGVRVARAGRGCDR
ncbi:NUDIX hydrolase [Streptomyces cyslabdanicus]|uniref:NUDIX hydrolase n=1 Tax=Streptomyces cyslabdanicus TaxID=1470456 RepID=UPI004044154E